MSYAPLLVILFVLVAGAAITLFVLVKADRRGLFYNLRAEAYAIFDAEEPPGEARDQLFASDDA